MRTPSSPRGHFDVVVVGGGVAGLSAALEARRRGLAIALIEAQMLHGGQIATVETVEDWAPTGPVNGPEVIAGMVERAGRAGVKMFNERADAIEPGEPHIVTTDGGRHAGRTVLLATGATRRSLGVEREAELVGRGISLCASCDGPLCRNRDVVVVGGGDAALQEAEVLSKFCKSVTIVVRGELKARRDLIDRVCRHGNVSFAWDSELVSFVGAQFLDGIVVRNVKTGKTSEIPCFALFPLIGSIPDASLAPSSSGKDAADVSDECETADAGIYAIGAARRGFSGSLASAAGDAATAIAAIARRLGV